MLQNSEVDLKEDDFQDIQSPKNEVQSIFQIIYPYKVSLATKKQIKPTNKTEKRFEKNFSPTILNDPITQTLREQSRNIVATQEQQIFNKSLSPNNSKQIQPSKTNITNEAKQILSYVPSLSNKNFVGLFDQNSIFQNKQVNLKDSNIYTKSSSRHSMHLFQNHQKNNMELNSSNQTSLRTKSKSINQRNEVKQHIQVSTFKNQTQTTKEIKQTQIANQSINQNEKQRKLDAIITNSDCLIQKTSIKGNALDSILPLKQVEQSSLNEQQRNSPKQQQVKQEFKQNQQGERNDDQTLKSDELAQITQEKIISTKKSSSSITSGINSTNNIKLAYNLFSQLEADPNSQRESNKRDNKNFIGFLNLEGLIQSNEIPNNLFNSSSSRSNRSKHKIYSSSVEPPQNSREIKYSQYPERNNDKQNNNSVKQCNDQLYGQNQNIELETSQNSLNNNKIQMNLNQQQSQIQNSLISNSPSESKLYQSQILSHKGSSNFNFNLRTGLFGQTNQLTNYSKSSTLTPRSNYSIQKSSKNKPQYHPFHHQSTAFSKDDQRIASSLFLSNLSKYQTCYTTRKNSNSPQRKSLNETNKISSSPLHQFTSSQEFSQNIKEKDEKSVQIQQTSEYIKQQMKHIQKQNQKIEPSQQNKIQQQPLIQQREQGVNSLNKSQSQFKVQEQVQNYFNQLKENQINQLETYQSNPYLFQDKDRIANTQLKMSENLINQTKISDVLQQQQKTQTFKIQRYKNKFQSYSQHQEKIENKITQIQSQSNFNFNQDSVKEEKDSDIQNLSNTYSQKQDSSSNLFQNFNFLNLSQKNKWGKIFQIYKDSTDYLIKSKKSIPQKYGNPIYQYQRGIKHKSSSSSIEAIYSVERQDNKNENSHLSKQQIQEVYNKKRGFKSIQESDNKQDNEKKDKNLVHSNSVDKNQITINNNSQQNISNLNSISPKTERNLKQSLISSSQLLKDQVKNSHIQSFEKIQDQNKKSFQQGLKSKIQSRSKIKDKNYLTQNNFNNLQDINHQQIIDKVQNAQDSYTTHLNGQNSPTKINLNNQIINQTEDENQYTSYSDRIKNDTYQANQIVQKLIDKGLIDEEPEIAEQIIKISKYLMDENISIEEKRTNFTEIQTLFEPESNNFKDKTCRQILLFLNVMKNYYLKIEPVQIKQNKLRDIINNLKRGKTSTFALFNSENGSINSIHKLSSQKGDTQETYRKLFRSSSIKDTAINHFLSKKQQSSSNILRKGHTQSFFAEQ